ncbi:hypothetical protein EUGRSUZ_F01349 [Eucalyptus grandis]|uniref:Uncharacterized protein n=2 Tax=Eucalyptus grandis TaxID=71139 RepID=A0ACC3KEV8_EUCGR|nr:hypothetical protein EUGRSUZ_F01349 [Eucalyptus grandis]
MDAKIFSTELAQTKTSYKDLKGLGLQNGSFTLRQIKAATNNFDDANKIGEGGFGSVYKGHLSNGTTIAVKQLSSKSKQGNREFVTEIGMIFALQHPHLVKLYGCCVEGNQLLLVFKYMKNNSVARALFGSKEFQLKLDWSTRHKICVGIAKGLAYLHEESRLKIVHRDIKATNVLLDKDLNPKISDFGLAKLDEEDNTHISTRIAGTYFGVVALEVVSGQCNISYQKKDECFHLLDWAHELKKTGNLIDLVDARLGSHFDKEKALVMIKVALLCTDASNTQAGKVAVPVLDSDGAIRAEKKIEDMRKHFEGDKDQAVGESITNSMFTEGSGTGITSLPSAVDLYPTPLDTDYCQNIE